MCQIHHGVPVFVDLVEHIVAEELDDVPVARLGPAGLARKSGLRDKRGQSASQNREAQGRKEARKGTHSGRSLINPNLHSSRTSLAFSSSPISSFSSVSAAPSASPISPTTRELTISSSCPMLLCGPPLFTRKSATLLTSGL